MLNSSSVDLSSITEHKCNSIKAYNITNKYSIMIKEYILLAITLHLTLLYIEGVLIDCRMKNDSHSKLRRMCRYVLPILYSLFFYLI